MSHQPQHESSTALEMIKRPGILALAGVVLLAAVSLDVLVFSDDGNPSLGQLVERIVPQVGE